MSAKIIINTDGFYDLIISFLLDKIINMKKVYTENDTFNFLMKEMNGKGMKPSLLQYWLETNGTSRIKYRKLKRSLTNGRGAVIMILKDENVKEDNDLSDEEKLHLAGELLLKIKEKQTLSEEDKEFARNLVNEYMESDSKEI